MNTFSSRRWVAALSLVLALAGCTAASGGGTAGIQPASDSRELPQATAAPEEGGPVAERQVVRTGSLTVRTADVQQAAAQLRALAEANNGFVSSEQLSLGDGTSGTVRIVLSVPSDSLARVMDEAAKVGELVTRSVTAKDVTEQVADVDARIRTLRESIERIRALMKKAGSIADIAQVEGELTRRQSDLESLLATQKALKNQVERAPITIMLIKPGQVDPQNPFMTGLVRGWEALQNSIAVLLTMIGGLLPFALVAGAIAWPLVRRFRNRDARAEKQAAKAAARSATPAAAAEGETKGAAATTGASATDPDTTER